MPVHIGARYTGKYAAHADTTTGAYWEALPPIEGAALDMQKALLAKPRPPRTTLRQRFNAAVEDLIARYRLNRALQASVGTQK